MKAPALLCAAPVKKLCVPTCAMQRPGRVSGERERCTGHVHTDGLYCPFGQLLAATSPPAVVASHQFSTLETRTILGQARTVAVSCARRYIALRLFSAIPSQAVVRPLHSLSGLTLPLPFPFPFPFLLAPALWALSVIPTMHAMLSLAFALLGMSVHVLCLDLSRNDNVSSPWRLSVPFIRADVLSFSLLCMCLRHCICADTARARQY